MAMYEERCLHSDVCKYGKNRTNGMYCTGERCLHFINRTKWADGVKTNADRIRAMSDEELAVFFADEIPHGDCYGCNLDCIHNDKGSFECSCQNAWYGWLKQPAE